MPKLLADTGSITSRFTANNANVLLDICDISSILRSIPYYSELENDYCLGVSFTLESLKATAWLIESLEKAPHPNTKASDTNPVMLAKLAEIENSYPKIGLALLKEDKEITRINLQNRGSSNQIELRYPFLGTGHIKLLGKTDRIKAKLEDYGHGLLKGKDYIAIEGDYTLEITGVKRGSRTANSESPQEIALLPEIIEKLALLEQKLTNIEQCFNSKPSIAELRSMNIVNFSSGILTIKPYSVSFAVQLSNWFSWIQNWNLNAANELNDLHPISELRTPLRQLNLTGCSQLKNIEALENLNSLERLMLYRVNCSQFNLPNIIQANLALHYLDVRQTQLTSSQVDAILVSFESTKTQRMIAVPPTSFNILLTQNESPSENGIAIINKLRADGWNISYS